MKSFTTSAQKTTSHAIEDILVTLQTALEKKEHIQFKQTKHANILKAKMNDGSTLAIAGFDKQKGKTLAMIDHENVPANKQREAVQMKWRNILDALFP